MSISETGPKEEPTLVDQAVNERVDRLVEAHDTVKNYAIAACTVGLVPIPFVDLAVLSGLQLKMCHSIAKVYDVPFAKSLIKSLITSLLSGSTAIMAAYPVGSLMKSIPIIGQATGALSVSMIGGAATYAVGKVFVEHFESGGTFLDFDAEKAKDHFKQLYEEGKEFASAQKSVK